MRKLSVFLMTAAVLAVLWSCSIDPVSAPVIIEGDVVNSSGELLSGVTVRYISASDSDSVVTNKKGHFRIKSPGGRVQFGFILPDYVPLFIVKDINSEDVFSGDVRLNRYSEDNLLASGPHRFDLSYTDHTIYLPVLPYLNYTFRVSHSWIFAFKYMQELIIQCQFNTSNAQRIGKVYIDGPYNRRDSVVFIQQPKL